MRETTGKHAQNAIVRSFAKMDPEVLATAEMLAGKYDVLLSVEHLAELFDVTPATVTQNISKEVWPIPVTKVGKIWYATAYAVAEYIVKHKEDKSTAA